MHNLVTRPPGLFFLGAGLVAAGNLFAYRFQFIRQRPDVAFVLLSVYGSGVVGLCALILRFL